MVRDKNPRRIEKFRETMARKRQVRLDAAYEKVKKDIGSLSKRDILIGGLHLYWAEGTKTARGRTEVANTDPGLIKAFLKWLLLTGTPKNKIIIRLQLYKDMNVQSEMQFWSKFLNIPLSQFRKPSIKNSNSIGLTRRGHGHGTCDLIFENMSLWEYISMSLRYLREEYSRP
jgi:hypothetical protein